MAEKNRGISRELLIHPGETIADLLEERSITQKELALRAGVSEAFLSDVINGKKDISKGLAMGLEYALGVPGSFWLNLQANYDAELIELLEAESVEAGERDVLTALHEVVGCLKKQAAIAEGLTPDQTVIELRKLFRVNRLTALRTLAPAGAFRMADKAEIDPDVLGAWLCLCKMQRADKLPEAVFEPERAGDLVAGIKRLMREKHNDLIGALKGLLAGYGIDFGVVQHFHGAPVQGYIVRSEEGRYQLVLTLRGAFADIFWFSLFHELGHIVNGDVSRSNGYLDAQSSRDERREKAADTFARRALLEQKSYDSFVSDGVFSYPAICDYADSQNVPAFVVIGRLQKEQRIPWDWHRKYIPRYKWAE